METFVAAAREWHALLRDVGEAFVALNLDAAMQLAVALLCQDDAEAARAAGGVSSAEQRDVAALSLILRPLLETATREHMTFLLPAAAKKEPHEVTQSFSLKTGLAQQQAIVQSLPEAFAPQFRQLLETHWNALNEAAERATLSLPRVQQLHYNVAKDGDGGRRVLVRLQTSDGQTRRIHVPVKQFHQLRHSAASVLQEMNQVEAHPMMRLAYMEQSRRTEAAVPATSGVTSNSVP
ncbi:hypothetical protein PHYPSEUDO_000800 [Phytophthora pseudosyringae]|uniref:COMM domain-containing protein n=1 Tax=Phytophthora pseudosyringae TaxID=221518 RepID=A0A8T1WE46_9STRA|nr:hypothetical protein PHYPSEUDO_000800 [Phytophthora pseudosyringae]